MTAKDMRCGYCHEPIHYELRGNQGAWWVHTATRHYLGTARDETGCRCDANTRAYDANNPPDWMK